MKLVGLRRLAVCTSFVLAVVGIAGCGGDDSSASGEFCDGLVAFNGAVTSTDLAEDASEADIEEVSDRVTPLWATVRDNAPDGAAEAIAPVNDAMVALGEGNAEPFNSDATFEAYGAFISETVGGCDFDSTKVTGVDYAFEDLPGSVDAGTAVIELKNDAETELHEFVAFRKTNPDQPIEEIFELPEEELEGVITFSGAVTAGPGATGTGLFDLQPGQYVAVCFLPVGGAEDGPPHFTEGMVAEFAVA